MGTESISSIPILVSHPQVAIVGSVDCSTRTNSGFMAYSKNVRDNIRLAVLKAMRSKVIRIQHAREVSASDVMQVRKA